MRKKKLSCCAESRRRAEDQRLSREVARVKCDRIVGNHLRQRRADFEAARDVVIERPRWHGRRRQARKRKTARRYIRSGPPRRRRVETVSLFLFHKGGRRSPRERRSAVRDRQFRDIRRIDGEVAGLTPLRPEAGKAQTAKALCTSAA